MSDPWGERRIVHTPLAAWIADYPEQLLISGVSSKHSPISTASAAQFGDPFPHPRRTGTNTYQAIANAIQIADPWDISQFYKACQQYHLNGVHQPFWGDWGEADPSRFLTPDALHQWHKFFYDHVLKWVVNIIGGTNLFTAYYNSPNRYPHDQAQNSISGCLASNPVSAHVIGPTESLH